MISEHIAELLEDLNVYAGVLNTQTVTYPAACYSIVGTEYYHDMDEAINLALTRFQFDVVGSTYAEMDDLSDQIRATLQSYRGGDIIYIYADDSFDQQELITGTKTYLFRRTQDYRVKHYI